MSKQETYSLAHKNLKDSAPSLSSSPSPPSSPSPSFFLLIPPSLGSQHLSSVYFSEFLCFFIMFLAKSNRKPDHKSII